MTDTTSAAYSSHSLMFRAGWKIALIRKAAGCAEVLPFNIRSMSNKMGICPLDNHGM